MSKILSIVMAVFNRKEMVQEMIESIIANDFHDWELIMVDDGSDVETLNILESFCHKDERICLIKRDQDPKGPLTCRNIGMERAHGEYIIFFDSDDYITPTCLSKRVTEIEKHPQIDFLIFPSGEYTDGEITKKSMVYAYGVKIWKDDIAAFARRILPFVVVNNIYRLSTLKTNNIRWDTKLKSLEDADFNMQCILSGLKYDYVLTQPDYGYRILGNTLSLSKKMCTHYDSHLHALDKFYNTIQKHYGNKYNQALFEGLMSVFTMVGREGFNPDFIVSLRQILKRYDKKREYMLIAITRLIKIMMHVIPQQKARQIATLYFIAKYRYLLTCLKPQRIHCKLKNV
ncbi:MAG: glycosyltransferase [Bacteroidaceae bacterium]|nr:glycosyltransferase [Bacteroidaceae bacterium]